jgi:hypothetical protein
MMLGVCEIIGPMRRARATERSWSARSFGVRELAARELAQLAWDLWS